MSAVEVDRALTAELRAQLEAASTGGSFDAESALAKVKRLERTIELLRRVSLHSYGEFENRIRELSLLSRVGEIFVSVFEVKRVCRALLEVVVEAVPCDTAYLHLSDSARELHLEATVGREPDTGALELAESAAFLAVSAGEPTRVPDTDAPVPSGARGDYEHSFLACPMEAMGETLGAIVLAEPGRDAFSQDHARILRPVADLAALAIRHARECAKNLAHQRNLEKLVDERTREVNQARAALSVHERTAAIGKLAASIAHEVNNPMSFLVSNMERAVDYTRDIESSLPLLLDLQEAALQLPDSGGESVERARRLAAQALKAQANERLNVVASDFRELISETRDGVDRIKRVGEDLRGFAQGVSGVMEAVDMNRLVETAIHIVQAEAKDRVEIRRRLDSLPDVRCQQYQITQVLLNLLKNAVEAIEGEGEVRVTTRLLGRWVEIEIADEGPGIPPDQMERIFEPFLTTKLGGSGLGLSISRDIVNQHQAVLDVQSSSRGSTFTLRLAVGGPGSAPSG